RRRRRTTERKRVAPRPVCLLGPLLQINYRHLELGAFSLDSPQGALRRFARINGERPIPFGYRAPPPILNLCEAASQDENSVFNRSLKTCKRCVESGAFTRLHFLLVEEDGLVEGILEERIWNVRGHRRRFSFHRPS